MRALTLAPFDVLGLDEIDTGAPPLLRERVCVIHVHVDRSTTHALRIDAASRKMDRQLVAMGEGIPLVMMRCVEAQLLVVGNGPRHIRDYEDGLDADDTSHTDIIRDAAAGRSARSHLRVEPSVLG
jgi:hypothetical protein